MKYLLLYKRLSALANTPAAFSAGICSILNVNSSVKLSFTSFSTAKISYANSSPSFEYDLYPNSSVLMSPNSHITSYMPKIPIVQYCLSSSTAPS